MSGAPAFDEHAETIARRQYFLPQDTSIATMFRRVATWVAGAETPAARAYWAEHYFELMHSKRFCPGGRVLAGAGTQHGNALNCFVQGATENDPASFAGVMEVAKKLALVTKVGGGNGVNLDVYPPRSLKCPDFVRGFAYMSAAHPDAEDFVRGLMRPPTQPDGDKQPTTIRNWTRVVYGAVSADFAALARQNGVLVVKERPEGLHSVPDNMAGIIDSARSVAETARTGKSPRLDLSSLRPEGSPILGSGGTSSGPVSFLFEIFDNFLEWANLGAEESGPVNTLRYCYASVLRVVRQGGSRRGAGMATIAIEHPDILDFLTAKDLDREAGEGDISTFNISILINKRFWQTLQADALWELQPLEVTGKYYIVTIDENYTGVLPELPKREVDGAEAVPLYTGGVPARWLWREIAKHAWSTGEPGLIFVDRINEHSAVQALGGKYLIKSTNPCGEVVLTVGEPCDLGAINLAAYVDNGHFDFVSFRRDVHSCIRFLDDVLDVNVFALPDNREASQNLRRLGLGVMGLADCLIKLGLRYDSASGRAMIEQIMGVMREEAIAQSEELGRERGVYPVYSEHAAQIPHAPRRNVAVLTVAPTGTTSMLFGVSSGIEPVFSPFIWRKIGSEYRAMIAPLFQEMLESHPVHPDFAEYNHGKARWNWDKVTEAISQNHGSAVGLEFVPQVVQDVFICAHDITPLDHVRMQGTVQTAFDSRGFAANSLSKTINLPNHATVEDVKAAYSEAYRTGCKGITVYRDGSRQFQVLSTSKDSKTKDNDDTSKQSSETVSEPLLNVPEITATPAVKPPFQTQERPSRLTGATDMVKLSDLITGQKRTFLITTNTHQGRPFEVVVVSGRAGDEANADSEALGRVVSIALQHDVPAEAITRTLRGINGGLYGSYNGRLVASKADLIAVALESTSEPSNAVSYSVGTCSGPQACGGQHLVREEGCVKCQACGYSKCG